MHELRGERPAARVEKNRNRVVAAIRDSDIKVPVAVQVLHRRMHWIEADGVRHVGEECPVTLVPQHGDRRLEGVDGDRIEVAVEIEVTERDPARSRDRLVPHRWRRTIKEFVLARTLGAESPDETVALELEALLRDRLRQVEEGRVSKRSALDIFQKAIDEAGPGRDV